MGRMTPEIVFTDSPDGAAREPILRALIAYSEAQSRPMDARPVAVLLKDPSNGAIIGGLWGRTAWGWLHMDTLYVPDALRRGGIGSKLVRMAEEEAIRRGCRGAWLDTFSFQARGFYERLGYRVIGTIEDQPPGHARHFLQKALAQGAGEAPIGR
jgi:ribosomal protein S18 acetylase RimI-like enzyme